MIHKAPTTWDKRGHPMMLPPIQKRAPSFSCFLFLFSFFWLPNHPLLFYRNSGPKIKAPPLPEDLFSSLITPVKTLSFSPSYFSFFLFAARFLPTFCTFTLRLYIADVGGSWACISGANRLVITWEQNWSLIMQWRGSMQEACRPRNQVDVKVLGA